MVKRPKSFGKIEPRHRTLIITLSIVLQQTGPVRTARFSNGSVLKYGYLQPATIESRSGKFTLDVNGFLAKRISDLIPGNPDKSANNLAFEQKRGGVGPYLYQAVPVSQSSAIGIIGYSWISSSTPGDGIHDLVLLDFEKTPKIELIRNIPLATGTSGPTTSFRLFKSKNDILLRQRNGFEIIDKKGQKTGELRSEREGIFVGLNSQGDLVFVNHWKTFGIDLFNLSTRQWKFFATTPPDGHINYCDSKLLDSKRIQLYVSVNVLVDVGGKNEMQTKSIEYTIDALNGKLLAKLTPN